VSCAAPAASKKRGPLSSRQLSAVLHARAHGLLRAGALHACQRRQRFAPRIVLQRDSSHQRDCGREVAVLQRGAERLRQLGRSRVELGRRRLALWPPRVCWRRLCGAVASRSPHACYCAQLACHLSWREHRVGAPGRRDPGEGPFTTCCRDISRHT
jgi:hypothetical protein